MNKFLLILLELSAKLLPVIVQELTENQEKKEIKEPQKKENEKVKEVYDTEVFP